MSILVEVQGVYIGFAVGVLVAPLGEVCKGDDGGYLGWAHGWLFL